jgi:quercetin dioxygenase-like cupin family protein
MTDRRAFLNGSLMSMAAAVLATRALDGAMAPSARQIAQRDLPKINLDGWQMTATEVTYPAGESSGKHHHPGFVIGYVLEGEYRFAVNDEAPRTLKTGEMFFESFDAPNQSHALSGAGPSGPAKILAIVFTKKGDPTTIPG